MTSFRGSGLIAASAVVLAAAGGAYAQAQASSPVAAQNDEALPAVAVETVVITAQKREENLQSVPMTISAFSAKTLDDANLTSLQDITKVAPALLIGEGTGQATTFVRGVGNPIRNIGDEASVPVYFDDVYYARIPSAFFELNNVRDVEVLEGPQGTLYGRNAEAGLLNIHTRDPGQATTLEADLGYGNYDTVRAHLYLAQPLTNNLAMDFAGIVVSQGKGWGEDVTTHDKTGYEDILGFRSKVVWAPSSRTEIKLSADDMNTQSTDGLSSRGYEGLPSYAYGTGTAKVAAVALPSLSFYDVQGYYNNVAKEKGYTFSAEVTQDLDFAKLTSISAYRRTDEFIQQDGTNSPSNLEVIDIRDHETQLSQEFRLSSEQSSKLKWLLGAYYLDLTGSYPPFVETGPALGGYSVDIASTITTRSYAGFGQFDYEILPHLTATLGGRYTGDEVSGDGSEYYSNSAGKILKILVPQTSARSTFDKFTYKAAINYVINHDISIYASTSTGFKAGTYPSIPFSTTVVPPETLTAYELGLRSEWLNRRLRLNLTGFHQKVDNYQVQVVQENTSTGAFSLAIASAPRVHSEGIEASGEAVVSGALSLNFALTLQEAKYDTYENAPFYTTPSPYGAGYALTSASADGKYLARAPEVAMSLGETYKLDTPIGPLRLNANWKHTSTYYWDPDNLHSQGPVDLVDANIKYVNPDPAARWSIEIWAKNLLNKKYYWGENEAAGATPGVVAPPLTFGFTLGYKL